MNSASSNNWLDYVHIRSELQPWTHVGPSNQPAKRDEGGTGKTVYLEEKIKQKKILCSFKKTKQNKKQV